MRSLIFSGACLVLALAASAQQADPAPPHNCPPPAPELTPLVLAQLRSTAKDVGPLWRLEKDGRVSWLYGTIHVGRLEWQVPGPKVRDALKASDTLALEANLSLRLPEIAAAGVPNHALRIDSANAAQVPQKLAVQIDRFCAVPVTPPGSYNAWLNTLSPEKYLRWIAGVFAQRSGLFYSFGIEHVLIRQAVDMNKPIAELEKAEDRLAYANLVNQRIQHLSHIAAASGTTESNEAEKSSGKFSAFAMLLEESVLAQLESGVAPVAAAWAAAQSADCTDRSSWCWEDAAPSASDLLEKQANLQRESRMADALSQLHDAGQQVFAAVGMAHVEPSRLPALMRARGFIVEFVRN